MYMNRMFWCTLVYLFSLQLVVAQEVQSNDVRWVDKTVPTADLYVYRGFRIFGFLIGYNLFVDNAKIGTVKINTAFKVSIPAGKEVELWAKTEAKRSLVMTFKEGESYYLNCGIGWGIFVGRPKFKLVNPYHGEFQYQLVSKQISRKEYKKMYRALIRNGANETKAD